MPERPASSAYLRLAELRQSAQTRFSYAPDAATCAEIAAEIGADQLRKTRLDGILRPAGQRDWRLEARLGATAVQPCIVTLEPVTTRIDRDVTRHYVPQDRFNSAPSGAETEMPDDDTLEPLPDQVDLRALLTEALSLALPSYPRKDGAELGEAVYSEAGVDALRDGDVKPFAGLAALRDKMRGEED